MKYRFTRTAVLFAAFAFSALSQELRGTITGVVTDPTGSQIAGAKVTVLETHTNTKVETVTDSAGQYAAPFLLPGDYDISVQFSGFKEFVRKAVHLGAGEHPRIDVSLEVGDASQTVSVTADAPLVNSENASIGQAITTKEVEDLPLNGRTPMMLASLSIGVISTGAPGSIYPFTSGGAAAWSIGGTPSQTSELLVDGSPNATWDGRLAYSPPQDAVQEVRVKAFDSDAAFGHTGGGTLNQIMKTGTNQFRGSLWEFNQPSNLTANNFFNNKNGLGNPVTHYNQYGATVGGPVILPKLYNGRDRLFWFFAWEGIKDSQPNTTFTTVPTAKERQGDFSDLLKLGSNYQLYDPYTAVLNGTTVTRSPYPNNIIPKNQLNPIALAYLQFYPLPNIANARSDGFGNYGNTANTVDDFNNEMGRLDYNLSDRHRMFFNVRRTGYLQTKNNYFQNNSTGSLLTRANWGASLDEVFTLNPTNVINVRLNFTRMGEDHPSISAGFNPTELGFPAYLAGNSQYLQLPSLSFATNSGFQNLGETGANRLPSQSVQLFGNWVKLTGSHTLKFGGDLRQYRLNTISYGNSAGNFSFSANTWVRAASNASSTVFTGQDFAEFLLGLPTGGSFDLNTYGSFYSYYWAGFFQDDWRIRRNLTLNLGIRFDRDGPYNEKYGRSVNGFDSTVASPLSAAASAAYARNPISQLPAAAFNVRGGLTFADPNNTAIYQNTSHLFSPRFGFAWTPDKFGGKTVVRGGIGMFVQAITIASLSVNGNYSTNPILAQEGYSQQTALTASNDNFVTPAATLSNPYPNGIKQPVGSSLGLATFLGQNINFLNPNMKSPYSVRFNFDIQQELAKNLMLEVAYIGNHAVHQPISVTQLNGIPRQYLSTMATRDQPLISSLTSTVPNPFAGLSTTQNGANASVAQLLANFPQFPVAVNSGSGGILVQNLNVGSSYYHALNIRVLKRFSNGLSLTTTYIHSKLIERDSWLNDSDPQPEKRISPFDHPNRFVTAFSYQLPIGRGQRYNTQSKLLEMVLGGWRVNSIYTYQTGAPLTWVNGSSTTPGDYVYFGGPLQLQNRETSTAAFDTTRFETNTANQLQYHIRTFSTTFQNIRQDGVNQLDGSILKNFTFTERSYLQLRFEAFNLINHPTFSAPNTTATNSQFGLITAQYNKPRMIQVGARIVF